MPSASSLLVGKDVRSPHAAASNALARQRTAAHGEWSHRCWCLRRGGGRGGVVAPRHACPCLVVGARCHGGDVPTVCHGGRTRPNVGKARHGDAGCGLQRRQAVDPAALRPRRVQRQTFPERALAAPRSSSTARPVVGDVRGPLGPALENGQQPSARSRASTSTVVLTCRTRSRHGASLAFFGALETLACLPREV